MLKIPVLLWERSKPSGKIHLCKSLKYRWKQQVWWPSSMEYACVPTCVPLPRCCFRDPLLHEVTKKKNYSLRLICGFVVVFVSCLCWLTNKERNQSSVPCSLINTKCETKMHCSLFVGLSWSEAGAQCHQPEDVWGLWLQSCNSSSLSPPTHNFLQCGHGEHVQPLTCNGNHKVKRASLQIFPFLLIVESPKSDKTS